jgi:hypothetical protein
MIFPMWNTGILNQLSTDGMMVVVTAILNITFQNSTIETRTGWTTTNRWGTRDVVIDVKHIKAKSTSLNTPQEIGIKRKSLESEMDSTAVHHEMNGP